MDEQLTRRDAETLLQGFNGLIKAQNLYPPGHVVTERATTGLARTAHSLLSTRDSILLAHADGYLIVGGHPFLTDNQHAAEFLPLFQARVGDGVILNEGVRSEELGRFCQWLRAERGALWSGDRIREADLVSNRSPWARGLRSYRAALDAVRQAHEEAREGRIPDTKRAQGCVLAFGELLADSPSVLPGLVLLKDYDTYTYHHSVNVCLLALGLGRQLGLGDREMECLGTSGLLHDIGKTRVTGEVVRKPGKLSASEWAAIAQHPLFGQEILKEVEDLHPMVARVVYEHHMRFDGSGYPCPPSGYKQSPLTPLVTTADAYDAMTTHRPYSRPRPLPGAIREMVECKATHFHPKAVDALVDLVGKTPVGSVLRLDSGEVAVASRVGDDGQVCRVKVVIRADGVRPKDAWEERALSPSQVVRWLDPLGHGIDPLQVLRGEAAQEE